MEGKARMGAAKDYLMTLVGVIVFPIAWLRGLQMVRRHTETDPRGVPRYLVAIVVGVVLAGAGAYVMVDFHRDNVDGIYDSLDNRMSIVTGNEAYKAAVDEGRTEDAARLEPNHALYEEVQGAVLERDGAEVRRLVAERPPSVVDDEGMEAQTDRALRIKDDSVSQLDALMLWFVYPGIVGAFFAPMVWSLGRTLRTAYEPSEGVGFKAYPHGAASLFLLFGAFGVPALFFAAWTVQDLDARSQEGQITL